MLEKPDGPLRRGWTTGACAAAAARAAYHALITGILPRTSSIRLPRGETPVFAVASGDIGPGWAEAAIIKDAGDDPDITHGALIQVRIRPNQPGQGIRFEAGPGVGTVTRQGLPIPPGEPAINPGPRQYIAATLSDLAVALDQMDPPDLIVTISIPGGVELARQTMNGRLGIIGGLSILGTTGIVVPYSCAAWIHAIHRGIDVARAAGLDHLAASTGSTSENAVKALYGLPDHALLDMGDFVGGTLKYLARNPVQRLTIAGGFGKMVKLAAGHLDLHSSRSRVDIAALAQILADQGAPPDAVISARAAASAAEILVIAQSLGAATEAAFIRYVAVQARDVALASLAIPMALDVAIFDRAGRLAGHSA